MKATKRSYKLYAAWEYEKEEEDLNASSEEGWQLVKGGSFSSTFRKDGSIHYVYQLDYTPHIKDPIRYKEMFAEQGWEYINSTFNGWHYFRKTYEEGINREDYKIYTDKESLYKMQNRWVNLAKVLFFVYLIFTGVYVAGFIHSKEPMLLIQTIIFTLLTATFGLGIRSIRLRQKGLKNNINMPIQIILPLAVALLIGYVGLWVYQYTAHHNTIYHTHFTYTYMPNDNLPSTSDSIVIEKADDYKLDLDINAGHGQIQVIIQDSNEKKVFETSADVCRINNHKITLDEGRYNVYFNYLIDSYNEDSSKISVNLKLKK